MISYHCIIIIVLVYFSFIQNTIIIATRNDTNLIPLSINSTFCKNEISNHIHENLKLQNQTDLSLGDIHEFRYYFSMNVRFGTTTDHTSAILPKAI